MRTHASIEFHLADKAVNPQPCATQHRVRRSAVPVLIGHLALAPFAQPSLWEPKVVLGRVSLQCYVSLKVSVMAKPAKSGVA
jgi:hypothetical protein